MAMLTADEVTAATTPADVVDDDTLQAVRKRWQDDRAGLPLLVDQPVRSGRLTSPANQQSQTGAYATAACELAKREFASSNGKVLDVRKVTLTVRGVKADVVAALGRIGLLFNRDTVLIYPSNARFIKWGPAGGGGKLTQEAEQVAGQDFWAGSVEAEVTSVRAG